MKDLRLKARLLYATGESCSEIAEQLKVSRVTVWRWCRDILRGRKNG